MIEIIYQKIGFFYRKFNILLSIFFINIHLDDEKRNTNKIFNEIKKFTFFKKKKIVFDTFKSFRVKLIKIILDKNKLQNFLREDEIHKVMFGLNRLFFFFEFIKIIIDKNWKNTWSKIIKEEKVGSPIPYFLYPNSSGNRIHDTFNLKTLIDLNEGKKNFENVIEFGGGYGCLCNLFKKIYTVKCYLIYDLPEVNALQYYYLRKLNYNVYINKIKKNKKNSVYLFNEVNKLNKFIKNNKLNNYIFLSNWGFSEVPLNLRKKFNLIISKSKITFLAFQKQFKKINNFNFFLKILFDRKNKTKVFTRIFENHYYLLSRKN